DLELSLEDGLTVARVKVGKIKGASRVLRAAREMRLSMTLWRKARNFWRERSCDLIIFYSPTIFFGSLVRRLKSLWKCPAYLILRDIFPQWALDAGVMRPGPIYRFFQMKELEQYAAADFIGVQSPANREYLARRLPELEPRLEVLYNWMKLDEGPPPVTHYRDRLGLQNKVVLIYGGNIGLAQDLDNLIRLAWNLRDRPHLHLLLVGEGSEVERIEAQIAEKGLSNIRRLPAVPQEEYLALLSEFDVGLVSLDRRLSTHNFPGKILGYAYLSQPILGSVNPGNDLKDLLEVYQAGLCSFTGDDETLCANALALADDAALRLNLGGNARRLLEEKFSVTATARQILLHFQNPLPAWINRSGADHGDYSGPQWQVEGIKA
ncbi:MAG TPA: glycosyltransferase family 4 protein, partial [Blastocatellia bacterium]|nr:glycosyltransferase family 4 protein [Blastocatellia bacterium]